MSLFIIFLFSLDTLYLSLDSALSIAERRSVEKMNERYNRTLAREKVLEEFERVLPSPYLNLSYAKRNNHSSRSYGGEIGLSQILFSPELVGGLVSTAPTYQYYQAQSELSRLRLKYLTKTSYYQLLKFQEIYRVKREERIKKELNWQLSEEKYRLQRVSNLERLRSENDFLLAKMEEENAYKNLLLAQENLKAVIGEERELFIFATSELTPPEETTIDFLQFWKELEERHPEWQAVKKGKDLSEIALYSAIFKFLPTISLSLSSYYSDSSSFPKSIRSWQEKDLSHLSLYLSFPILDITGYLLNVSAHRQERKRAEIKLREGRLSLYKEAKDAFLSLNEANTRFRYAQKNFELAKEILRLGEEEKRLGLLSYLDFLDIETKYANAYQIYITSLIDIYQAKAKVDYLIGKK